MARQVFRAWRTHIVAKIKIDGREVGKVAGDWTILLRQSGQDLVLDGFERNGKKITYLEAVELFDFLSSSSRAANKRPIGLP